MERVLNVYKPQGMTPLQAIDAIREEYPEYRSEKMTYAGRLDPMAEGVLVVLVGDAVREKETYLKLDKVYEADVVFGLGTDTHDLLGMPMRYTTDGISDEKIEKEAGRMEGVFEYALPIYSSKPVNGRPLFQWAREGRVDEIEIPTRSMCVYSVKLLERYYITPEEIGSKVDTSIACITGDFRQNGIREQWRTVLADMDANSPYRAIRIHIHCASGTYVRTLAHELGRRLGTDAVLMRLVRTYVGAFTIDESARLK